MRKRSVGAICVVLEFVVCLNSSRSVAFAQASSEGPKFEVASVKQSSSESDESNLNHELTDRFVSTNVPLGFLILDAYEIRAHQLVGAPDWIWNKLFDVIGIYPGPNHPKLHEIHQMEQHLLAERFGFRAHPEQREVPAYDLVLAKKDGRLGPQIQRSTLDCVAWTAHGRPEIERSTSAVSPTHKRPTCDLLTTRTWLSGGARTIADVAASLQAIVGRPVINKTGLTGRFDIDLQWSRTDLRADESSAANPSDAPPIFGAVEEQLGFKLVTHKEPFNVLVVDHIQAPTPN